MGDTYTDTQGIERCDDCREEVSDCTCECGTCGDQVHECACDAG